MGLKKKTKSFNVIIERNGEFIPYDIMPYFVSTYNKTNPSDRPKTYEEFREFVDKEAKYMYWSRCEYEIILSSWPGERDKEKWDIYKQIMMNHDLVTEILMNVLKK